MAGRVDAINGSIITALGILGMVDASRMSHRVAGSGLGLREPVGPDLYLKMVSAVMIGCGLLQLWLALTRRSGSGEKAAQTGGNVRVGLIAGAFVLYLFAVLALGYLIASLLFFATIFSLFGYRPWYKATVIGMGVAVVFYLCFVHLMGVELPKGWMMSHF